MPKAPSTNGNGHTNQPTTATESKSALEVTLEQIETIKGSHRNAIRSTAQHSTKVVTLKKKKLSYRRSFLSGTTI
jgi:hypothetical protein